MADPSDPGRRTAAVAALRALARSGDHRDRVDAGEALSRFVDVPGAPEAVLGLVLDPDDTAVTRATTAALVRRHDDAGLGIVAAALVTADDDHEHWIGSGVVEAVGPFGRDLEETLARCDRLAAAAPADRAPGWDRLRALVLQSGPVS